MKRIESGATIGIIGGGQLGKMSVEAAHKLGYKTHIFCPKDGEPATLVTDEKTIAEYDDESALEKFSNKVDVITFEFENIPAKSVHFLEQKNIVRPRWKVLEVSQNRLREKRFIKNIAIDVTPFYEIKSKEDLESTMKNIASQKAILKTVEMGYDGKGQFVVDKKSDFDEIWKKLAIDVAILEEFVPFDLEFSVIIARNENGEKSVFPPAKNIHKNGVLDTSTVPSGIEKSTERLVENEAQSIAGKIADELDLVGILAVEFFLVEKKLFVNEIAPRPHNSGHWSMDGCETSQFEQFIRAVCGIEFGNTTMTVKKIVMKNLIGDDINNIKEDNLKNSPKSAMVHLYGKKEIREGRKMGHINYVSKA